MKNQNVLLASILIVAAGLLVLNPSLLGNAQGQIYANDYGYDSNYNSYPEAKSSHTDVQKIKCVNSNINVNVIDITPIPQDPNALEASENEGTADAENLQNSNGLADRINFERNLVNICVNVNDNEQINGPDELTCEDCWLSVLTRPQIAAALEITNFDSIDELCDFFAETPNGNAENLSLGFLLGGIPNITDEQKESIVNCLAELGLITLPPP
jgi:hypothetical protein